LERLKVSLNFAEERRLFRFVLERDHFARLGPDAAGLEWGHEPLVVEGEVARTAGTTILAGRIETVASLTCCRCLEEAREPLQAEFRYLLLTTAREETNREELTSDDLDAISCPGEELNLEPLIFEQMFLQLPMKPLCGEDCRGLCPRCGENLNRHSCRCQTEKPDNPFAVLRNLSLKNK
jgi:uncharacterized protein